MTRLNTNQWLALVFAVLAAGYIAMAWQIPIFPLPRPVDSDLFPKVLGFSLLILSVFLFSRNPLRSPVPMKSTKRRKMGRYC
ncbi:hypothetical protein HSBAA_62410 [Vreelandella sulfidaeris]|uniref:Tripartite tricarboxylate transporter TctB family protein n=1 Tax=Vreelandella sulfidaeris TaxID=115553 RepID=A0A455UFR2_9GAMM|nr:hypothetical protein HSBAA_62410 [Halomonas sulfidaeris]